MITWPRVRIFFFWVGLFSALYNGYAALGTFLAWIADTLQTIANMF